MTAHASLPEADLHECKGASTATVGKTIVAGGAGTATFKYANPHGAVYYTDLATGTTITYPSSYTIVNPTTTAVGMAIEFTEATTAKLTYTGTDTLDCRVLGNITLDQSAGADRDIYFKIYKNGVAVTGTEVGITTQSGKKVNIGITFDIANLATNDYLEIYCKNNGASGDVKIYSFYLTAFCMRG
jgi:hypothetical protein